jgi:hypothetical protein
MAPTDFHFHHSRAERQGEWEAGQIAYLPSAKFLSPAERDFTFTQGGLMEGAFDHPVIVVGRPGSATAIVTSVSCFGSDERTGRPAPWVTANRGHGHREAGKYRNFAGSQAPPVAKAEPERFPALRLKGNSKMPLPRSSWIYIDYLYEVPVSCLRVWGRMEGRPRLMEASLCQLQKDIAQNSSRYRREWQWQWQGQWQSQGDASPTSAAAARSFPAANHAVANDLCAQRRAWLQGTTKTTTTTAGASASASASGAGGSPKAQASNWRAAPRSQLSAVAPVWVPVPNAVAIPAGPAAARLPTKEASSCSEMSSSSAHTTPASSLGTSPTSSAFFCKAPVSTTTGPPPAAKKAPKLVMRPSAAGMVAATGPPQEVAKEVVEEKATRTEPARCWAQVARK